MMAGSSSVRNSILAEPLILTFPQCEVRAEVTDLTGLIIDQAERRPTERPIRHLRSEYDQPKSLSRRKRTIEIISASALSVKKSLEKNIGRLRKTKTKVIMSGSIKGSGIPLSARLILKWGILQIWYNDSPKANVYLALSNSDVEKVNKTTMKLAVETLEIRRESDIELTEEKLFHISFGKPHEMSQFYDDVRSSSKWKFEAFYNLDARISRGAFGEVFECSRKGGSGSSSRPNSEKLACKVMKNLNQPRFDDVIRELDISVKLQHNNIIQVKDILITPFNTYLVLPRLQTSLLNFQNNLGGQMTEDLASYLILKVLRGIAYLHDRAHVLHRDLKPANILVTESNRSTEVKPEIDVKICDFGHSTEFPALGPKKVELKGTYGTPAYLPPEVVQKQNYSDKSDIWAIGVTLYQLFTGTTPFEGKNEQGTYKNIRKRKPKKHDKIKSLSRECRDFIYKLLTKSQENRPEALEALFDKWFDVTKGKTFEKAESLSRKSSGNASSSSTRHGVKFS